MKTLPTLGPLLLVALPLSAQQRRAPDPRSMGGGDCRDNIYNCADTPNPLPPATTVWLEEMTWMDVRDALRAGTTTAIVPTGGMEPNGPWLVTGKHNYVLHANCDAIARKLGNAICTPIIKLVPEGDIEPPSGHMRSPGTISVREETFRAVLTDVARSLKMHGFRNIIFIGDSGGNQTGQRAVAETLRVEWNAGPVVAHVQEYYDYASAARYMAYRGLEEGEGDGLHDDPIIALNMFADDPSSVRYDKRVASRAGEHQRRVARRSGPGARVGARDRRVPGRPHRRRDQQGDRTPGNAAGAATTTTDRRRPGEATPGAGPTDDGWRRLPRQCVQLLRHPEPAASDRHGLARRNDLDGCPRRPGIGEDHRHHSGRRHRAERTLAGGPGSTTTYSGPTATRLRATSATRSVRRSWSWFLKGRSSRRAVTCAAPAP